mgnify:CR=1 FL=1
MDDLSPNQANRLSGAQGYWGTAFVLALIAHGLLFVLLFVSMQWRSEPTGPVYAELWNGDMPAAEAPPVAVRLPASLLSSFRVSVPAEVFSRPAL